MTQSLVLVPGLNNTRRVFDNVISALPAEVRGLAVDNPALESVEAIAEAVLSNLPDRFWLAGFSFGGYVALAMLDAAPERVAGIAMICTTPFADSQAARDRRLAALEAVAQGRYLAMAEEQAANAFHPKNLGDADLMQVRKAMVMAYGPERYVAHTRATMARPDRTGLLDGSRPTLVVTASHDTVIPPKAVSRYAAEIPGVCLQVVDGAGHLLPMEEPAILASLLANWIASPHQEQHLPGH